MLIYYRCANLNLRCWAERQATAKAYFTANHRSYKLQLRYVYVYVYRLYPSWSYCVVKFCSLSKTIYEWSRILSLSLAYSKDDWNYHKIFIFRHLDNCEPYRLSENTNRYIWIVIGWHVGIVRVGNHACSFYSYNIESRVALVARVTLNLILC